ncbi:MAG: hypothetical protein QGH15_15655 [Kiritimatiellia bacterium]|nr:hypothetical protein [Kiritimatiellia bacterium]
MEDFEDFELLDDFEDFELLEDFEDFELLDDFEDFELLDDFEDSEDDEPDDKSGLAPPPIGELKESPSTPAAFG